MAAWHHSRVHRLSVSLSAVVVVVVVRCAVVLVVIVRSASVVGRQPAGHIGCSVTSGYDG